MLTRSSNAQALRLRVIRLACARDALCHPSYVPCVRFFRSPLTLEANASYADRDYLKAVQQTFTFSPFEVCLLAVRSQPHARTPARSRSHIRHGTPDLTDIHSVLSSTSYGHVGHPWNAGQLPSNSDDRSSWQTVRAPVRASDLRVRRAHPHRYR